jgi:predicted enzyme related to lactoylglutathione lyase
MARVIGLGGIIVSHAQWDSLAIWYHDVLGLAMSLGRPVASFQPASIAERRERLQRFGFTAAHQAETSPNYSISLCVDDLDGMLERCQRYGVEPVWREDARPEGRVAMILDPSGMGIELWQPKE